MRAIRLTLAAVFACVYVHAACRREFVFFFSFSFFLSWTCTCAQAFAPLYCHSLQSERPVPCFIIKRATARPLWRSNERLLPSPGLCAKHDTGGCWRGEVATAAAIEVWKEWRLRIRVFKHQLSCASLHMTAPGNRLFSFPHRQSKEGTSQRRLWNLRPHPLEEKKTQLWASASYYGGTQEELGPLNMFPTCNGFVQNNNLLNATWAFDSLTFVTCPATWR